MDILRRTANVLKGKPSPNTWHDISDLPKVAQHLKRDADREVHHAASEFQYLKKLYAATKKSTNETLERWYKKVDELLMFLTQLGDYRAHRPFCAFNNGGACFCGLENLMADIKKYAVKPPKLLLVGMSETEEHEFWETHDSSEFELGEDVNVELDPKLMKRRSQIERKESTAVIDFYVELGPVKTTFVTGRKHMNPDDVKAEVLDYGQIEEFMTTHEAVDAATRYAHYALATEDINKAVIFLDGNELKCFFKKDLPRRD